MDPTPDERSRRPRSATPGRRSPLSARFLPPQEKATARGRQPGAGGGLIFAEGRWPAIRVALERQGWSTRQIELVQDRLLQGWPLDLAKEQVGVLTGQCPLRSRRLG